MDMADPTAIAPLPPSVEKLLHNICTEQSKPPPDIVARRKLASIGEEASLQLLHTISPCNIGNISPLIMYMAKKNGCSPQKKACLSSPQKQQCSPVDSCLSPQKQQFTVGNTCSSPQKSYVQTIRWYGNSQGSPSSTSENSIRQAITPQSELPSSCSENPTRPAITPQSGLPSSYSENRTRPASSPQLPVPYSSSENTSKQKFSPHSITLGELEFRKAFLILSYTGGKRLEDVTSVDEIRCLKHLSMREFELQIWNTFGYKYCKLEDRRTCIDWDSGKTYLYNCYVHEDGSHTFKGPFLKKEITHLQRVLGDENVLNVRFAEGQADKDCSATDKSRFNKVLKDGIFVGLRCYRFFVFKDGGKEEKKKDPTTSPVKCYFVRMESHASIDFNTPYILSNKTMHEARCLFMHAHTVSTVAKYMARFSLILSKTIKLEVDFSVVHVEEIEDIPCRDKDGFEVYSEDGECLIHTDGTGFISEDLAAVCSKNIYKGKHDSTLFERILNNAGIGEKISELQQQGSRSLEYPLLIQCRMFYKGCAVKGTYLVNRKLPPGTILYRTSMLKVRPDPGLLGIPTINSLEIVGTGNKPKKTYLSRYLIALLCYGGVPEQFFLDILMDTLEEAQSLHYNTRAAFRASLNYGELDDFNLALMISSGIPVDEPLIQHRLSVILKEEKKGLKGGKIPISDSFYLMGTTDPTGLLKSDQVCIILESGQISGKVLVYKHPGLHYGDIHVLNATYVKEMEDYVGNAKYAILFPTQGPRSLADEMAGSDFDGDMYFVSRNYQLLNFFKPSCPWIPTKSKEHLRPDSSKQPVHDKKPSDLSAEELEHQLFQLFLATRFQPSRAIGVAADSWMVFMDRLLILRDDSGEEKEIVNKKLLQLIDIYYDALDAPKSGKKILVPERLKPKLYPHYMERFKSYNSSSILGQIFDQVESYQIQERVVPEISLLPCLDVEVPESCLDTWNKHYKNYLSEMQKALNNQNETKNESAEAVIEKYKQILYDAPDFEQTQRNINSIFDDALAIYKIVYENAKSRRDVGKCQFAWRVAGKPLCMLYVKKQGHESLPCSLSFLRDIFC